MDEGFRLQDCEATTSPTALAETAAGGAGSWHRQSTNTLSPGDSHLVACFLPAQSLCQLGEHPRGLARTGRGLEQKPPARAPPLSPHEGALLTWQRSGTCCLYSEMPPLQMTARQTPKQNPAPAPRTALVPLDAGAPQALGLSRNSPFLWAASWDSCRPGMIRTFAKWRVPKCMGPTAPFSEAK